MEYKVLKECVIEAMFFKSSELYRYLDDAGVVGIGKWGDKPYLDEYRMSIGNVMKTQEETIKARNWLQAFNTLKEDMKDFKHKKSYQQKYSVYYDKIEKCLRVRASHLETGNIICFATENDAYESVEKHPYEWGTYLGLMNGNL